MILTDTHTHLFLSEFSSDRTQVIARAVQAGVTKLFLPNIDSASVPALLETEKLFPGNCFPMMGLHPCSVRENYEEEMQKTEEWLAARKFYAVGETGMDFHWDKSFILQQKNAFARQIDLAKQYNLPVVIHQRECFEEVWETIKSKNSSGLKGIFHCFTGSIEQAEKIISLGGFKMGIGGVVTYKNSGLAKALRKINLQHIVLETDSPYLAPVPFRGKRNESMHLRIIAEKVADIKGISVEEVAEITTKNAEEMFGC